MAIAERIMPERSFIKKAMDAGLSPANAITWLCLEIPRIWGVFYGTTRLYAKARLLGVAIGKCVRAHGQVALLRWPGGKIIIGDNVSFISSWRRATACALAFPCRLRVFGKGQIIIGDGAELSGTSITARSTTIEIGKNVLVAPNCVIVDSDFHAHWPPEARAADPGLENDSPVRVGDYAWIGMGSMILKGVSIGKGAIIGAGSVVTRNVPDNCLACGAPAQVKRNLQPGENTLWAK